jgi:arylsulfatase A-like enzyme
MGVTHIQIITKSKRNKMRNIRMITKVLLLLLHVVYSIPTHGINNKKNNKSKLPNIVFLLTDDHRWDALGVVGNPIIKTPNIDALASSGVLFKNAYVTTSICCSSRASILTGQYTSRHGKNSFHDSFSVEEVQNTYPLLLKNEAGYKIGFIGKYGVGLDHPADLYDYWAVEKKHQPDYENYDENGNMIHHNDLVNDQIQEFLETFGRSNQPFCLSVSFKSPHVQDSDPRQFIIQKRFENLYADTDIPLPVTYDSAYYYNKFPDDFRFPKGRMNEGRKRWHIRFPEPEKYMESVRNYYRLITGVDECIGNMLQKLRKMGIDKNTIVIFSGDNGFYLAEHGLAGKWYGHQESVRVPLVIYDPGLPESNRGRIIEQMALNIDIAPTILSMAGIEIPERMQGLNLYHLISGKDKPWRHEFYYEHTINISTIPKSVGIIGERYTYLKYPELSSGFEEFYDLKKDPNQKYNLLYDKNYNKLVKKYREKTVDWGMKVK